MSVFSDRIKGLRDSKDWSKSKTAQKLNVSAQRYSNWEYGLHEPDYQMLSQIAKLFDTTTDYLTGKTDNPQTNQTLDYDLDKMIDNARSFDGKPLDEHDRELAREILKKIYK